MENKNKIKKAYSLDSNKSILNLGVREIDLKLIEALSNESKVDSILNSKNALDIKSIIIDLSNILNQFEKRDLNVINDHIFNNSKYNERLENIYLNLSKYLTTIDYNLNKSIIDFVKIIYDFKKNKTSNLFNRTIDLLSNDIDYIKNNIYLNSPVSKNTKNLINDRKELNIYASNYAIACINIIDIESEKLNKIDSSNSEYSSIRDNIISLTVNLEMLMFNIIKSFGILTKLEKELCREDKIIEFIEFFEKAMFPVFKIQGVLLSGQQSKDQLKESILNHKKFLTFSTIENDLNDFDLKENINKIAFYKYIDEVIKYIDCYIIDLNKINLSNSYLKKLMIKKIDEIRNL